ncbi:MAG: peptidoglycan DD-metalloendopeptidase family protein [Halioglobus sp.]
MIIFLVSCGGNKLRAPVEDRRIKPLPVPASYSVQRGDTLFSIAWRYGLDHRALAAKNRIVPPYTIFPGQRIYLAANAPRPVQKKPVPPPRKPPAKVVAKPPLKAAPKTPSPVAKPVQIKAIAKWRWPTTGTVSRGYSSSVHKGIDIDGKRGDPIYAVAAGRVVYAGNGIVGYGELLIVKHSDVYLSAYGHNSRLLVTEGAKVSAGQKIAEKGSSGTDTVKLHFEIRKEGKPIDPKRVLPAR